MIDHVVPESQRNNTQSLSHSSPSPSCVPERRKGEMIGVGVCVRRVSQLMRSHDEEEEEEEDHAATSLFIHFVPGYYRKIINSGRL